MRKISKHVSVVFLTLVMMFVMTACGETGNNGKDGNNDQKPAASQTAGVTNAVNTSADNEIAETVTLQLSLESDKNLAFSKYDMNVYFDGKSLSTLKNGEKYSTTLTVSKGSHELKLCKADDESLKGVETITLDGSKAISYFVKHDRNSIDISRTETKDIADDQSKNETTAPMTEEPATEKPTETPTEAPTEEPTTEEVTEEPTTEEETEEPTTEEVTEAPTEEPATSSSDNDIPVMKGTNIDILDAACKNLGIKMTSEDESIVQGVYLRGYTGDTGVFYVYYYAETKEILGGLLGIPAIGAWEDTVKTFATSMCPVNSSTSVSSWIDQKVSKKIADTVIDGFDYVFSNADGVVQYQAGVSQVENWFAEMSGNSVEVPTVEPTTEAATEAPTVEAKVMAQVKTNGLTYSTNDSETAKNGNSGKFAYKKSGKNYDIYYIIDFDEGYVYCFQDARGDISCEKVKIVSGDMNEYVLITYHADGTTWNNALSFKRKKQPNIMSFQDGRNDPVDYNSTDINKAIEILNTKTVHEY